MITCKYENCNNEVIGRSDKIYCCRACKQLARRLRRIKIKRIIKNIKITNRYEH